MIRLLWPDYRMFAYERDLAVREVHSLIDTWPTEVSDGLEVCSDEIKLLQERITYAQSLEWKEDIVRTQQALVEKVHQQQRQMRRARQATRFLVHGVHEYKGKFNPQLARALVNVADPQATSLLDPFCGCGTTLVEGLRLGMSVAGIDRSPLATWISHVKTAVLTEQHHDKLREQFDHMRLEASIAIKRGQSTEHITYLPPLDGKTLEYLRRWFPADVLAGLMGALGIGALQPGLGDQLLRLAVSSIVRSVSWQLPEDLRIRRRPPSWTPPNVAALFDEACRLIDTALAELSDNHTIWSKLQWSVHHGSCDDPNLVGEVWPAGRRLIVTSPPYATALPYIDTDRLSIALLGLAPSSNLLALERSLIGSREWTRIESTKWADRWTANADKLPQQLLKLLAAIDRQNDDQQAGFRRRAVPSLLYRYFASMGAAMKAWSGHMKSGERAVLVVGRNRTGPRGHQLMIDTPELLADLAPGRGFKVVDMISLETWPRYGMHANNGVNAELAVVLERDS
jgi:site-specific DNA-methyltransferase (cytosine-N4-specific)